MVHLIFLTSVKAGTLKQASVNLLEHKPALTRTNSNQQMLAWSKQMAINIFSLSAVNHQRRLAALRYDFTKDSWKKFQDAMEKSKFIKTIVSENLAATPKFNGPIISAPVSNEGKPALLTIIPMIITFENRQFMQKHSIRLELQITQNPKPKLPAFLVSHFNVVSVTPPITTDKFPACKTKYSQIKTTTNHVFLLELISSPEFPSIVPPVDCQRAAKTATPYSIKLRSLP